jgi:hypothetical protein
MRSVTRFLFAPTRECSLLGSRTVAGHLLRGAVAAASLVSAATTWSDPVLVFGSIGVALVAMRGCPMCWLFGLIETMATRLKA